MAVIRPTDKGLLLIERGPGVSIQNILDQTSARLIVPDEVPEMQLA